MCNVIDSDFRDPDAPIFETVTNKDGTRSIEEYKREYDLGELDLFKKLAKSIV